MRSSRLSALVVGIALALAVAMTVASGGAAKNNASAAKVKIGYINLSDQLPFVVLVRKSIERAAKANGAQLVECDSNLDAQKAINCAAQLKLQGVQGIMNFQLDSKAAPRVCAAGPKVPAVAIDIHQPPCEVVFFGANNFQAGKLAGTALGQYAKTTWNCKADAVLSLNAPTAGKVVVDRENGELAGVKSQCPGLKVVKVTTNATTSGSIQPFTDTLSRFPGKHRLLVVATNDDQSTGAVKAAQASGRLGDIYIGSQGGDPDVVAVALRQDDVQELDRRHGLLPREVRRHARAAPALPDRRAGAAEDGLHQPPGDHQGEHPHHLPERLQVAAPRLRTS